MARKKKQEKDADSKGKSAPMEQGETFEQWKARQQKRRQEGNALQRYKKMVKEQAEKPQPPPKPRPSKAKKEESPSSFYKEGKGYKNNMLKNKDAKEEALKY